ncbi:MAG: type II toxin-antitoxin system prevent-host-death family antitoxin [Candidatus Latescibacterota bacterium]
MEVTNIHDAKTHLSRLIERVARGEEIVIARAGRPVARLVPYAPSTQPRRGGQWRGRVRLAPDFDALPEELARAFQGQGA